MKTKLSLHTVKEQIGPYVIFDHLISQKSQIYLAYNKERKIECCAKILCNDEFKSEQTILQVIQLYLAIQSIYHDNIVTIYQFIYHPKNRNFYLFQELCKMNLSDYINSLRQTKQKLEEIQVLDFICQFTDGYMNLLEYNIIHRDIKPQNILIKLDLDKNKRIYKICDFGISKLDFDKRLQTPQIQGTMAYVAPEVRQNYQNTPASDIYSFGLVLLEILVEEELNDSQKKALESFLNQYQLTDYFNGKAAVEKFQKLKFLDKLKNYEAFASILNSLLQQTPEKRMDWQKLSQTAQQQKGKFFQVQQNSNNNLKTLPNVEFDNTLAQTNYNLNNKISQSLVTQLGQDQRATIQQNTQGLKLIQGQSNPQTFFNQNIIKKDTNQNRQLIPGQIQQFNQQSNQQFQKKQQL